MEKKRSKKANSKLKIKKRIKKKYLRKKTILGKNLFLQQFKKLKDKFVKKSPPIKVSPKEVKHFGEVVGKMRNEMGKIVIGQHEVINGVIRGLIANGHILVEGVPGIAKTLIIRTLAKVTGCLNNRIQFTVDLLPTDILGITAYDEKRGFYRSGHDSFEGRQDF